jgi:hypothetical protein
MWTYHQKSGALHDKTGHLVSTGYSGHGEGKNNPAMQHVPSVGPIPRGLWKMEEPYDSGKVGPFAIPLTPLPETETFGRSAFRVHGDSKSEPGSASHGCIIQPRIVRNQMWESGDRLLEVVE